MLYKKILTISLMLMLLVSRPSWGESDSGDEYQPGLLEEVEERETFAAQKAPPDLDIGEDRLAEAKDKARIGEIEEEKEQAMQRIEKESEFTDGRGYDY